MKYEKSIICSILLTVAVNNWAWAVECPIGDQCWKCNNLQGYDRGREKAANGSCLAWLTEDPTGNKKLYIVGDGESEIGRWNGSNRYAWAPSGEDGEITSVVIEGIKTIPDNALGSLNVNSLELGNSVTSVGFHGFTINGELHIPDSVNSLNFQGIRGVTSVVVPDSIKTVCEWCFFDTSLNTIVLPEGFEVPEGGFAYVHNKTFYCKEGTDCSRIGVKNGVKKIDYYNLDASGAYIVGDKIYISAQHLAEGEVCSTEGLTKECIEQALNMKALKLLNMGNICKDMASCESVVYADYNGDSIQIGSKTYASLEDVLAGNAIPKRIYTVEEAEKVSKKTGNIVRIRYK